MKIIKKARPAPTYDTVEVEEVIVDDMIKAERVAGKGEGIAFIAALVAQAATFDGQKLPMEEVAKLKAPDFFALLAATGLEGLADSLTGSSALPAKGDLA